MFKGKNVIITGGSSGLGEELACRLAAKGANLALVARNQAKLGFVLEKIQSINNYQIKSKAFQNDVCEFESVEQTAKKIAETMGVPDILINSAGILNENYFEEHTTDAFKEVMDTNFFGTLYWIKAVLPYFKTKGKGRVVNICSML